MSIGNAIIFFPSYYGGDLWQSDGRKLAEEPGFHGGNAAGYNGTKYSDAKSNA